MQVAVTDACIFIDLIELDIVAEFFQLEIELHTTVAVMDELFQEQKQVLEAYQAVKKLHVHNLGEKDYLEMEIIPFPRGLSQEDRSVIYLAKKIGNAIVLSSDKLVRDFAGSVPLPYHGIFWIFDELVKESILPSRMAALALTKLISINSMYRGTGTANEIAKRIQLWGKE